MKRICLLFLLLSWVGSVGGQNLVVGARAPELKVAQYITAKPNLERAKQGREAILVEFFVSYGEPSHVRWNALNHLAVELAGEVVVVMLSQEERAAIEPLFAGTDYAFSVALDEAGKTFSAYGVQYVPYAVLLDTHQRVIWFGNPTELTPEKTIQIIEKATAAR